MCTLRVYSGLINDRVTGVTNKCLNFVTIRILTSNPVPLGILFLSLLKHNQFLNCNPNSLPPCWQVIWRPVTFHHNRCWHSRLVPEGKWFSLTPRPKQNGCHFADDFLNTFLVWKLLHFDCWGYKSWNLPLSEPFWNYQEAVAIPYKTSYSISRSLEVERLVFRIALNRSEISHAYQQQGPRRLSNDQVIHLSHQSRGFETWRDLIETALSYVELIPVRYDGIGSSQIGQ